MYVFSFFSFLLLSNFPLDGGGYDNSYGGGGGPRPYAEHSRGRGGRYRGKKIKNLFN